MFKFCPSCAAEKIVFSRNAFRCPDCGFVYYHNTAAATGCVISVPETAGGPRLLFLVRGKEPAKGKLDLPGGFVDPGEGALECLYREFKEEIGCTPPVPAGVPLTEIFTLVASFPNVYPYKNIPYNTCDLYFSLDSRQAYTGMCRLGEQGRLGNPDGTGHPDKSRKTQVFRKIIKLKKRLSQRHKGSQSTQRKNLKFLYFPIFDLPS
jgi:hypothetical protein